MRSKIIKKSYKTLKNLNKNTRTNLQYGGILMNASYIEC